VADTTSMAVGGTAPRSQEEWEKVARELLNEGQNFLAHDVCRDGLKSYPRSFKLLIFGAIPFTDAVIVRYVDDRMRSRVAGLRLSISLGFSSLAVWALGPVVKASGFDTLLLAMAGIALCTAAVLLAMPAEPARADAAA